VAAPHGRRQLIPVVREGAAIEPAGYLDIKNAPVGHTGSIQVGGVYQCGCGVIRMSRANLDKHHDDVRVELAELGLKKARASAQNITLAEIREAYRMAGEE
jgi:hypothetical protein